ncbi:HD domain-containing protein [Mycoplasmatota bacterium WC44]
MKLNVERLNRILSHLFKEMRIMSDNDRELPMKWSIMHMYSSTQLACLTALKEGLDPEIAGLIACLHDVGSVMTGKRLNHAENAEPFIRDIITKYNNEFRYNLNKINDGELEIIVEAVVSHSDKGVYTNKPYVELMKNIDSLDRYLHGINTTEDHLERLKLGFEMFDLGDI